MCISIFTQGFSIRICESHSILLDDVILKLADGSLLLFHQLFQVLVLLLLGCQLPTFPQFLYASFFHFLVPL